MFVLERIDGPEIECFTRAQMRTHLRAYSIAAEDEVMDRLIGSSREWAEEYSGRAFVDQKWRLTLGHPSRGWLGAYTGGDSVRGYFPCYDTSFVGWGYQTWLHWCQRGEVRLRRSPVLAVTSMTTIGSDGVQSVEIDAATYQVREARGKWPRLVALIGATWNGQVVGDLRIEFRAGYVDMSSSPAVGAVPKVIEQAMLLWAEANYDRDEKMMPLLITTAENLLNPESAQLRMA